MHCWSSAESALPVGGICSRHDGPAMRMSRVPEGGLVVSTRLFLPEQGKAAILPINRPARPAARRSGLCEPELPSWQAFMVAHEFLNTVLGASQTVVLP